MRALRRKVHNVIQTVFGLVRASLLFVSLSNGLGHAVDGAGCLSLLLLLLQCSDLALAGDIFEGVGGCVGFNKLGGHIGPVLLVCGLGLQLGVTVVLGRAVVGGFGRPLFCALGPSTAKPFLCGEGFFVREKVCFQDTYVFLCRLYWGRLV